MPLEKREIMINREGINEQGSMKGMKLGRKKKRKKNTGRGKNNETFPRTALQFSRY
jgi:hypothetical protein